MRTAAAAAAENEEEAEAEAGLELDMDEANFDADEEAEAEADDIGLDSRVASGAAVAIESAVPGSGCGSGSGASGVVDDFTGGDALLRQYQFQFDDSQVDYDLILALLKYVVHSEFCKDGSVLIFLPGWDDISRMHRILSSTPEFSNPQKYRLIQLHSGIPRREQDAVFEPLRRGEHKIILSTNIAETSITIDDVSVVIDSGKLKEKTYDPHVKLSYLKSTWISQAAARQRKGRAGRTRAGVCFHLFSRRRHTSLPEFQDSELLRMPLEELVLQVRLRVRQSQRNE